LTSSTSKTLEVLSGLERIGFELAGQIIWDKGLFSVGRSWHRWAHEPCVVIRRPGVPNLFIGERDQATVWRAPSPKRIGGGSKEQKEDHLTQSTPNTSRSRSSAGSASPGGRLPVSRRASRPFVDRPRHAADDEAHHHRQEKLAQKQTENQSDGRAYACTGCGPGDPARHVKPPFGGPPAPTQS
jgi:hypothetical protein